MTFCFRDVKDILKLLSVNIIKLSFPLQCLINYSTVNYDPTISIHLFKILIFLRFIILQLDSWLDFIYRDTCMHTNAWMHAWFIHATHSALYNAYTSKHTYIHTQHNHDSYISTHTCVWNLHEYNGRREPYVAKGKKWLYKLSDSIQIKTS